MFRTLRPLVVLLLLVSSAQALELSDRKVDLIGKVDTTKVRKVVQKLLELNSVSHEPIYLHIDSFGGSVEAGYVLIDAIRGIASPVYALVESKAYSMAAIITLFCERRYALPHATLMFHEASYGTLGEDPSNRSKMEFNVRYLDRMHAEIAQRIGMSEDEYRAKIRDGWWMMADEGAKAGVLDEVVRDLSYRKFFVEKTEIKKTVTRIRKKEIEPDGAPRPAARDRD